MCCKPGFAHSFHGVHALALVGEARPTKKHAGMTVFNRLYKFKFESR
jgi:uncharacterized protein (UPF0332 family)